ncbi:hypothetical protein [Mycobacteroides abscessus]|uniref:hypothetical protein n=1 Tax=Mycobacteroides abscessus TaxID=36809 RepID=UPI000925C28A|nr:hypothetical protein [Mycobacteroides abscessus]SIF35809.1 Uncharacterised protein [Mycobacteroides abscessus subsp. abscessus]
MMRPLIVGAVSMVMAAVFAAPAHAEPLPCASVTTYAFVAMPPPWTPAALCEAHESLLDRTTLPQRDGTT